MNLRSNLMQVLNSHLNRLANALSGFKNPTLDSPSEPAVFLANAAQREASLHALVHKDQHPDSPLAISRCKLISAMYQFIAECLAPTCRQEILLESLNAIINLREHVQLQIEHIHSLDCIVQYYLIENNEMFSFLKITLSEFKSLELTFDGKSLIAPLDERIRNLLAYVFQFTNIIKLHLVDFKMNCFPELFSLIAQTTLTTIEIQGDCIEEISFRIVLEAIEQNRYIFYVRFKDNDILLEKFIGSLLRLIEQKPELLELQFNSTRPALKRLEHMLVRRNQQIFASTNGLVAVRAKGKDREDMVALCTHYLKAEFQLENARKNLTVNKALLAKISDQILAVRNNNSNALIQLVATQMNEFIALLSPRCPADLLPLYFKLLAAFIHLSEALMERQTDLIKQDRNPYSPTHSDSPSLFEAVVNVRECIAMVLVNQPSLEKVNLDIAFLFAATLSLAYQTTHILHNDSPEEMKTKYQILHDEFHGVMMSFVLPLLEYKNFESNGVVDYALFAGLFAFAIYHLEIRKDGHENPHVQRALETTLQLCRNTNNWMLRFKSLELLGSSFGDITFRRGNQLDMPNYLKSLRVVGNTAKLATVTFATNSSSTNSYGVDKMANHLFLYQLSESMDSAVRYASLIQGVHPKTLNDNIAMLGTEICYSQARRYFSDITRIELLVANVSKIAEFLSETRLHSLLSLQEREVYISDKSQAFVFDPALVMMQQSMRNLTTLNYWTTVFYAYRTMLDAAFHYLLTVDEINRKKHNHPHYKLFVDLCKEYRFVLRSLIDGYIVRKCLMENKLSRGTLVPANGYAAHSDEDTKKYIQAFDNKIVEHKNLITRIDDYLNKDKTPPSANSKTDSSYRNGSSEKVQHDPQAVCEKVISNYLGARQYDRAISHAQQTLDTLRHTSVYDHAVCIHRLGMIHQVLADNTKADADTIFTHHLTLAKQYFSDTQTIIEETLKIPLADTVDLPTYQQPLTGTMREEIASLHDCITDTLHHHLPAVQENYDTKRLQHANNLLRDYHFKSALACLESLHQRGHHSEMVIMGMVTCYDQLGMNHKAISLLEMVVTNNDSDKFKIRLGEFYTSAKQFLQAKNIFSSVKDTDDFLFNSAYLSYLINVGDISSMRQELGRLNSSPRANSPSGLYIRASAYAQTGDTSLAADLLKQLSTVYQDLPPYQLAHALFLLSISQLSEASSLLRKLIKQYPNYHPPKLYLAEIESKQGLHDDALASIEVIILNMPDYRKALEAKLSILLRANRMKEASRFKMLIDKQFPENVIANGTYSKPDPISPEVETKTNLTISDVPVTTLPIPHEIKTILQTLNEHGTAYLYGQCVLLSCETPLIEICLFTEESPSALQMKIPHFFIMQQDLLCGQLTDHQVRLVLKPTTMTLESFARERDLTAHSLLATVNGEVIDKLNFLPRMKSDGLCELLPSVQEYPFFALRAIRFHHFYRATKGEKDLALVQQALPKLLNHPLLLAHEVRENLNSGCFHAISLDWIELDVFSALMPNVFDHTLTRKLISQIKQIAVDCDALKKTNPFEAMIVFFSRLLEQAQLATQSFTLQSIDNVIAKTPLLMSLFEQESVGVHKRLTQSLLQRFNTGKLPTQHTSVYNSQQEQIKPNGNGHLPLEKRKGRKP